MMIVILILFSLAVFCRGSLGWLDNCDSCTERCVAIPATYEGKDLYKMCYGIQDSENFGWFDRQRTHDLTGYRYACQSNCRSFGYSSYVNLEKGVEYYQLPYLDNMDVENNCYKCYDSRDNTCLLMPPTDPQSRRSLNFKKKPTDADYVNKCLQADTITLGESTLQFQGGVSNHTATCSKYCSDFDYDVEYDDLVIYSGNERSCSGTPCVHVFGKH